MTEVGTDMPTRLVPHGHTVKSTKLVPCGFEVGFKRVEIFELQSLGGMIDPGSGGMINFIDEWMDDQRCRPTHHRHVERESETRALH